jgi:hypothetical protein
MDAEELNIEERILMTRIYIENEFRVPRMRIALAYLLYPAEYNERDHRSGPDAVPTAGVFLR